MQEGILTCFIMQTALPQSERYQASKVSWTGAVQGPKVQSNFCILAQSAYSKRISDVQDKSLSTIYAFLYEHLNAISAAVLGNQTNITVDYRLPQLFEILLDASQDSLIQYVTGSISWETYLV